MAGDGDAPRGMSPHQATQMLQRSQWAASVFARYDRATVRRIAEAAADAVAEKAQEYAEWAVKETGFGNPEHKAEKNRRCSRGIFDAYADDNYTDHVVDADSKMVAFPRPAGVVFALTPATNPVASVAYKITLALLTRNTIVLSPHPAARGCCADAAHVMAAAAERAGAPAGTIQVVAEPDMPTIETLMKSPRTDVILATGGSPMVRAAYSSGNPALGVGPGNCPAYVDRSADAAAAAKRIADSKAYDNSVLCTNESAVIAHDDIAKELHRELQRYGVHLCDAGERDKVAEALFPAGRLNTGMIGKSATWIAEQCGIRVKRDTRVIGVPLERIGDDYPLSREKLCPVLGLYTVSSLPAAISAAQAMVRKSGDGHSAAVHASDPEVVLHFGDAIKVLRVAVNAGCSTGASGFDTYLAPTMTVGTGFYGRSSASENVKPEHLIQWVRLAYNRDPAVEFPDFSRVAPPRAKMLQPDPIWDRPVRAGLDNAAEAAPSHSGGSAQPAGGGRAEGGRKGARDDELREEILQIVREELRDMIGNSNR